MKYIFYIFIVIFAAGMLLSSCSKYQDKKAVQDPRLTNPYCNDPNAVNYNWGFPGKADNSICIYPTDLFRGVFLFHDSVTLTSSGFFIHADSLILTITAIDKSKFIVTGLCGGGGTLRFTAASFQATADTTIGDSITNMGQAFCSLADTVNGTITRDRINDSLIYFNLQVYSDTGVVTTHFGSARKIQ